VDLISKYWFSIVFILGIAFAVLVPPFQSPDEFNHFYRVYQQSEGHFWGEIDSTKTKLGGYIPQSLINISPLLFCFNRVVTKT
jgi:Predicted membrane protein (DUF2142)